MNSINAFRVPRVLIARAVQALLDDSYPRSAADKFGHELNCYLSAWIMRQPSVYETQFLDGDEMLELPFGTISSQTGLIPQAVEALWSKPGKDRKKLGRQLDRFLTCKV